MERVQDLLFMISHGWWKFVDYFSKIYLFFLSLVIVLIIVFLVVRLLKNSIFELLVLIWVFFAIFYFLVFLPLAVILIILAVSILLFLLDFRHLHCFISFMTMQPLYLGSLYQSSLFISQRFATLDHDTCIIVAHEKPPAPTCTGMEAWIM